MSVRKLLPIVLFLAAVSIRCSGSPSEPEGVVLVTQTTSTTTSTSTTSTSTTTTVIPAFTPGAIAASPGGQGLAAATVFSFVYAPLPSGGVPPYTFMWNFGDGAQGTGAAPTHVYLNTGTFTAAATAIDSRGMTAQASAEVIVRNVTGRWIARFPPASGLAPEPIDLVQNQTAVTATINSTNPMLGFASGTGTVSNPRVLNVSLTFKAGTPGAFGVTYGGQLDDSLSNWSGNATGYPGCPFPCAFTAERPAFEGDSRR